MAEGFVKIRSFWSLDEANLCKIYLESHGIDVELEAATMVGTVWLDANAIGGVKLLVKDVDSQEAIQLLDFKADTGLNSESTQKRNSDEVADESAGWQSDDVEEQENRNRTPGTLSRMRSLKTIVVYIFLIPMLAWALGMISLFVTSFIRGFPF